MTAETPRLKDRIESNLPSGQIRRARFDRDQQLEQFAALNVAIQHLEGAMRKAISCAAARPAADEMQSFVAWWSTAMWCGALIYLLWTFQPY